MESVTATVMFDSAYVLTEAAMQGWKPAYIFGCSRQPACAEGGIFATACSDGIVRLWELKPGASCLTYLDMHVVHKGICTACAFNSRGTELAVTCRDGSVAVLVSQQR